MAERALFLFLALLLALLPAADLCPERCECGSGPQHVLCANRGLQAVPGAPPPESARLVLVLGLAGNFIDGIGARDLARYGQLARLDLQFNRIERVHPRAFARLSELRELYLGHNLLSAVPRRALRPLTRLAVLYVNHNAIEQLDSEAFRNLTRVQRLRLDGNALETLRESVFAPLSGLVALRLESNRLRHVHHHAFANLTRLQFLNLSDNRQTELRDDRTFARLESLNTLLLARNHIAHVGARIFQDLQRLATLSLSGNRIVQLEPEALVGLSRLRELALDGNALTEVSAGVLDPLERLEHLDLSANQLARVHEAAFAHLARLRVLTLRDNRLAKLAGGALAANAALRALDLRDNEWTCGCRAEALRSRAGGGGTVAVRCRESEEEEDRKEREEREDKTDQGDSCTAEDPERIKGKEDTGVRIMGEEDRGVRIMGEEDTGVRIKGEEDTGERMKGDEDTESEGGTEEPRAKRRKLKIQDTSGKRGRTSALTAALTTKVVPIGTEDAAVAQQRFGSSPQGKQTAAFTDACNFNRLYICNVTVGEVTDSTAVIRWGAAAVGELALLFRVYFDRLGGAERFPRYVYEDGASRALTLRELRADSAYLACVESVVGGVSCHVASREHCVGFVTGAGVPEARAWPVAAAALAVSGALALLLGGAGLWRALTRRRRSRRIKGGRSYSYSARTPFRAAMATACASSEFSAFRSGRALSEEGDLIQFTTDRVYHSPAGREEDITIHSFSH